MLIHPTVWPQYTQRYKQDRQRSNSIGRTGLQMVTRKQCVFMHHHKNVSLCLICSECYMHHLTTCSMLSITVCYCHVTHLIQPLYHVDHTPQGLAMHVTVKHNQLEMWANAQRDGRPAKYRWRPLFNAAVWLCSNAAKTRNPLKFAWVPKLTKRSQPLVGRSSPYCKDMWGRYCCLTSFF